MNSALCVVEGCKSLHVSRDKLCFEHQIEKTRAYAKAYPCSTKGCWRAQFSMYGGKPVCSQCFAICLKQRPRGLRPDINKEAAWTQHNEI